MAIDSKLSLAPGEMLISIWNATVTSDPEGLPVGPELVEAPPPTPNLPSGSMVKPDGKMCM